MMPITKSVAERHRHRSPGLPEVDQSTSDKPQDRYPVNGGVCARRAGHPTCHPSEPSDVGHTEKIAPRVPSMQVACQPSVIVGLRGCVLVPRNDRQRDWKRESAPFGGGVRAEQR